MADSGLDSLAGVERAAVFLLALGEQEAAQILRHMGAKEVQKVGEAMARLDGVTRDQLEQVLDDFSGAVVHETSLGIGSEDYIRNVLNQALGEENATGLIDRILSGTASKGLESLRWMDARQVTELIRGEHPQVIAIVLAYLDQDQAAEVLTALDAEIHGDVILRIATLDGIQPSALTELDEILQTRSAAGGRQAKTPSFGGPKVAADILNRVNTAAEEQIIAELNERDGELGQQIKELMFVFDNLLDIDDRNMQTLLREVSSDVLVVALKGADEAIQQKIFGNMSERAAEVLRDDLEVRGPVKLSEVEEAQKEVLTTAHQLAESGQITLGGKGEEYV